MPIAHSTNIQPLPPRGPPAPPPRDRVRLQHEFPTFRTNTKLPNISGSFLFPPLPLWGRFLCELRKLLRKHERVNRLRPVRMYPPISTMACRTMACRTTSCRTTCRRTTCNNTVTCSTTYRGQVFGISMITSYCIIDTHGGMVYDTMPLEPIYRRSLSR